MRCATLEDRQNLRKCGLSLVQPCCVSNEKKPPVDAGGSTISFEAAFAYVRFFDIVLFDVSGRVLECFIAGLRCL